MEVEHRTSLSHRKKAIKRNAQRYTAWCQTNSHIAFPASYNTIAGFICQYVDTNKGSTKSIGNVISSLKVFSYYIQCNWLNEADRYRLSDVRKQLEYQDSEPIHRKKPITLSIIHQILRKMNLHNDYELLLATSMLIAHNGLLRSGELLSGIRVSDIVWDDSDNSFSVRIARTKTTRTGNGDIIRITDYPGASAYKFLKTWFNTQQLWLHPDRFVIPSRLKIKKHTTVQFNWNAAASCKWWRTALCKLITKADLKPADHSGHSFRAGGATDLFAAEVPYPKIKLFGRWKSDSAMVYYRDDIEVSHKVAIAFGNRLR